MRGIASGCLFLGRRGWQRWHSTYTINTNLETRGTLSCPGFRGHQVKSH
jgi:hypothetical protein